MLPVGSTLVLFTDGLVESRSADIDEGLAHLLAAAVAEGTSDPDELCDRLLADLTGAHRADDIALLALTRLPYVDPLPPGAWRGTMAKGPRAGGGMDSSVNPVTHAIDGATVHGRCPGTRCGGPRTWPSRVRRAASCAGWTSRRGSARGSAWT